MVGINHPTVLVSSPVTQIDIKLVLAKTDVAGMNPMIGYSMISYDSTLNDADLDYDSEKRYLFGFEKKF